MGLGKSAMSAAGRLSCHRWAMAMWAVLAAVPVAAQDFPQFGDELYRPRLRQPGKDVMWLPTPDAMLEQIVAQHFDLTPGGIIRDLDLLRPIYRKSAAFGHFGREEFPWEAIDRADDLRRAVE